MTEGLTCAELDRADTLWPDMAPSPWNSMIPLASTEPAAVLVQRSEARYVAHERILALRGRARHLDRGWDNVKRVSVGNASGGLGGIYLCHVQDGWWELSWTRNLVGFEPLDDEAAEVLAFVALHIERDHHLGDRAYGGFDMLPPPRDSHLRYLREYANKRGIGLVSRL